MKISRLLRKDKDWEGVTLCRLFAPLPTSPSTASIQTLENDRIIIISLPQDSKDRRLCKFIFKCLHLSWSSYHPSDRCLLHPKLAWKNEAGVARLEYTGEIIVQLYRKKLVGDDDNNYKISSGYRPKFGSREDLLANFEIVCSGAIDVVHSQDFLGSKRYRIPEVVDLGLVRKWVSHCGISSQGTPVSLLDLPFGKCLKAINTTTGQLSELKPGQEFIALSYVWGANAENLTSSRKGKITKHTMDYPATIRDAAILSRNLGYDWLWVDRICIDQTDDAEKAILIPHIKDIFAAAKLTIVAACGNSAHAGLAGVGGTKREAETPCRMPYGPGFVDLLPSVGSFNMYLTNTVWNSRGWTLEEYVFSRRLLYVFPTEMVLTGSGKTCRESLGEAVIASAAGSTWGDRGGTPPTIVAELHAKLHAPLHKITAREYVRAVEEYCSRELTFEEDRINAFAGLITVVNTGSDKIPERPLLLHGHPLEFFETLLTWHHDGNRITRTASHGRPFAPSWSWASAGAKLRILDNGEQGRRSHWFRYSVVDSFDMLGVLNDYSTNPLLRRLGLRFPYGLTEDKPWEAWTATSRAKHEENATAGTPHGGSLRLPVLHLVTVVFEATFCSTEDEQHAIKFEHGDTETCAEGDWSLSGSLNGERYTFAIVAGYMHIYIMLLRPESEQDTFSRLGLYMLSWDSSGYSYFVKNLRRAAVRWAYIRIV